MNEPENNYTLPLPQKRQWWLAGLAFALAAGSFFIPQHIPLEWYPLNNPGNDINYLEIKCASDADGWVTIFYDITHGWNDIDQIRFPISPTEQTYTYTFPLPDGPMIGLRLDPVAQGGTLSVHHMRIINRRNEEIQAFPIESVRPIQQIANIRQLNPGWAITSTADAVGPITQVEPFPPIVPVGMNKRNLYRCLLSTSYLAGMLVIIMLAVTTAFWRPKGWMDFFAHVLLLVLMAIPFSAVGNRGLIRNSIHYARFSPLDSKSNAWLFIDLRADVGTVSQLFWDIGNGMSEKDSWTDSLRLQSGSQIICYQLPHERIRALRFDPAQSQGSFQVIRIWVTDSQFGDHTSIPLDSLLPQLDIAKAAIEFDTLRIETEPNAKDPMLNFKSDALTAINAVISRNQQD